MTFRSRWLTFAIPLLSLIARGTPLLISGRLCRSPNCLILRITILLNQLFLLVQKYIFWASPPQVVFRFGCLNTVSGVLSAWGLLVWDGQLLLNNFLDAFLCVLKVNFILPQYNLFILHLNLLLLPLLDFQFILNLLMKVLKCLLLLPSQIVLRIRLKSILAKPIEPRGGPLELGDAPTPLLLVWDRF